MVNPTRTRTTNDTNAHDGTNMLTRNRQLENILVKNKPVNTNIGIPYINLSLSADTKSQHQINSPKQHLYKTQYIHTPHAQESR